MNKKIYLIRAAENKKYKINQKNHNKMKVHTYNLLIHLTTLKILIIILTQKNKNLHQINNKIIKKTCQ